MRILLAALITSVGIALFSSSGWAQTTRFSGKDERSEGAFMKRFRVMDTNNNGYISRKEFMAKRTDAKAEETFNKWDTNKDGRLSKEEVRLRGKELRGCRGNGKNKVCARKTQKKGGKASKKDAQSSAKSLFSDNRYANSQ